jgi:hypothetical protein
MIAPDQIAGPSGKQTETRTDGLRASEEEEEDEEESSTSEEEHISDVGSMSKLLKKAQEELGSVIRLKKASVKKGNMN